MAMADRTFKIASLWRREGERLVLKEELKRCEDQVLKQRLLGFLQGGAIVLQAPGLREDRLDPSRPAAAPLGYLSDGEWIWPQELGYYLEAHDILPEDELVEHARLHRFEAAEPTPPALAEALRLLTEAS
jgi:hypothetical protein